MSKLPKIGGTQFVVSEWAVCGLMSAYMASSSFPYYRIAMSIALVAWLANSIVVVSKYRKYW
ncbi:MAG TPA: hypothetical protein VIB82_05480, partial [Caulobacteraceae bacterium]